MIGSIFSSESNKQVGASNKFKYGSLQQNKHTTTAAQHFAQFIKVQSPRHVASSVGAIKMIGAKHRAGAWNVESVEKVLFLTNGRLNPFKIDTF
jgi:hypothetical protein